MESLKNEQEKTTELEAKMKEVVKERDSLNRQLSQSLPQVSELARLSQPYIAYCFDPNAFGGMGMSCAQIPFHGSPS